MPENNNDDTEQLVKRANELREKNEKDKIVLISSQLDQALKNASFSKRFKYIDLNTLLATWEMVGRSFRNNYKIDGLATKYIRYFSAQRQDYFAELKDNDCKGIRVIGKKGLGKSIDFLIYQRMVRLMNHTHFRHYEMKEIEFNYKLQGITFLKHLYDIPELAISDLGTEEANIKDFGTNTNLADDILSMRYIKFQNNNFITHITTNMNNAMYHTKYGDRHDDRANEMFINILAEGEVSKRR